MAEMLMAVLILLLVSSLLTGTVTLAIRQYDKSMRASQSKTLCSTLETLISNELAFTTDIVIDDHERLLKFQSPNYATEESLSMFMNDAAAGAYGRILIGDPSHPSGAMNLLGRAAYNRNLFANIEKVTYDRDDFCFSVVLVISYKDEEYFRETFDVKNINKTVPKIQ